MDQQSIQARIVEAMLDPARYDHPVEQVERIETHISTVLLAGDYAYKLKKPLDLGFLDFTSLDKRRRYCDEELRLNRRYAASIYRARVDFTGSPDDPRLNGAGDVLEHAVCMRRFPQSAVLDHRLAAGEVDTGTIEALARRVADFHAAAAVAGSDSDYGTPERVSAPIRDTLATLKARAPAEQQSDVLALEQWCEAEVRRLEPAMSRRREAGRVRECHGDLHLANIVDWDGTLMPFDGIEFDPALRWIDVLNDIAFTVMDLEYRGADRLARRLENSYLEQAGDYDGLALLRLYKVYRALVRAKIAGLRAGQLAAGSAEQAAQLKDLAAHVRLARSYTRPPQPRLVLTFGVSGSGKSTVSQHLVDALGFVRLRSDVERKRLFEMAPTDRGSSSVGAGIYGPEASRRTYERLLDLADTALAAGERVVVDAAFLHEAERLPFTGLAATRELALEIVWADAPASVLADRLRARQADPDEPSDAGLEVMRHQLEHAQWPQAREGRLVRVNTSDPDWREQLEEWIASY